MINYLYLKNKLVSQAIAFERTAKNGCFYQILYLHSK